MALGDMLARVDIAIERLGAPERGASDAGARDIGIQDDFHRQIAARLRDRVAQAIEQRWRLIFSARSTISWPFLVILTAWLSIIFGIFGLTAPRNSLVYAVVVLAALSIASPLYLILDYSEALDGTLQLSSEPMQSALAHMDRAD